MVDYELANNSRLLFTRLLFRIGDPLPKNSNALTSSKIVMYGNT